MKRIIVNSALFFAMCTNLCQGYKAANPLKINEQIKKSDHSGISFTENKGQIVDQNYNARPDVLFGGQSNGLAFHLRNNGISYQLHRVDIWSEERNVSDKKKRKMINQQTIYRIDINWLNANTNAVVKKEQTMEGCSNFYTQGSPACGALNVKSYREVTYQNLYKGIDLKWYEKNGDLKYDYFCAAGTDYKQIQLKINGAERLNINSKGELEITTPLGTIVEQAPLVLQAGKELKSKWLLTGKVLSFEIEKPNKNLPYIIDPLVRIWGTYYGGSGAELSNACNSDAAGNIYMTGNTSSATSTLIATVGAHQTTYGGSQDAYLVKFNSLGVRQWSTYYGGGAADDGASCSIDGSGNVYVAGTTGSNSGTLIATSGSHQSAYGGGFRDAFLVKFNASGVRQWGTYYGGTGVDEGASCTADASGNVYLLGRSTTATSTAIATTAAHQNSFGGVQDVFLVKFNTSGIRQWGTYYGGSGIDIGNSCALDASGNIYIAGYTDCNTGTVIATTGAHQATFGGSNDGFLVKFNTSGVRQWGTYYGGVQDERASSCCTDPSGNIYIAGFTPFYSGTLIVTSGAHQTAFGGVQDAFLVKFSSTGLRLWGTYYGGSGIDDGVSCSTDASSNVYLGGRTASSTTTLIATTGAHQTTFAGGTNDAFLVGFNSSGVRQWGTYFGGSGNDEGLSCTTNGVAVYLAGLTDSNTGTVIASSGGHQTVFAGATDGFLAKFIDCTPLTLSASVNTNVCTGSTINFTANVTGTATPTYSWNGPNAYTSNVQNPIITNAGTVHVGVYTVTIDNGGCTQTTTTQLSNVNITPSVSVNSGSICSGNSFTILPNGASSYTIQGGNSIVSPTSTSNYTVVGASSAGCVSQNTATANVIVNPNPTITAVSSETNFICVGQSATLTANGALNYTFTPGGAGGSIVVSPTITTTYNVIGTDGNGCQNTATITQSVSACTNLEDITASHETRLNIYPNPTNGVINLNGEGFETGFKVQLTNALGQTILTDYIFKETISLDLAKQPNGIYFLQLITKNKVVSVHKIIKQ